MSGTDEDRPVRPDPVIITRDSWGSAMVPVVLILVVGLCLFIAVVLA